MKEIQIFKNELFGEIRTLTGERGEPLFVGKDVAKALGYSNTRDALRKHVDTEDKTTVAICDTGSNYKNPAKALRDHVDTEDKLTERIVLSGQRREVIFINESGLYSLILSSCTQRRSALPLATEGTQEPTPCVRDANERAKMVLRYATLLLELANIRREKFDEVIVERKGTTWWVHFAVRPDVNRSHVTVINKSR